MKKDRHRPGTNADMRGVPALNAVAAPPDWPATLQVTQGHPNLHREARLAVRLTISLGESLWRRIDVDISTRLDKLRPVLLAVMPWPAELPCRYSLGSWTAPGGHARIADLAAAGVKYFEFHCRHRCWFKHAVLIENVTPASFSTTYPHLVDGGGMLAMEDFGGSADRNSLMAPDESVRVNDEFNAAEIRTHLAQIARRK